MKRLVNDDLEFFHKKYVEGKYKIKCKDKTHIRNKSHTFTCMRFLTEEAEVIERLIREVKHYKKPIEQFIQKVANDNGD